MIQSRSRPGSPVRGIVTSAVVAVVLAVAFNFLVAAPAAPTAAASPAAVALAADTSMAGMDMGGGNVAFDPQGFPTVDQGQPGQAAGALNTDCDKSALDLHDGFQKAPRCVATNFGEVATEGNDPSLLITSAPLIVASGQDFTIKISTRNLVRNRFLGAAAGGYYVEGAVLNDQGITEGHAHLACRTLTSRSVAPDPAPVPGFFQAIEDNKGGKEPDTVSVTVAGRGANGKASFNNGDLVQCAAWAGDGSHRTPMMQRANQTPAFDVVRIRVVGTKLSKVIDRLERRGRDDQ